MAAVLARMDAISSLVMVGAACLTPNAKLASVSYLEIVSASRIGVFIFAVMLTSCTLPGLVIVFAPVWQM